jgi:hypothetical protein
MCRLHLLPLQAQALRESPKSVGEKEIDQATKIKISDPPSPPRPLFAERWLFFLARPLKATLD